MRDILTKKERGMLMEMAEHAVSIPEGEKCGRWTRKDRVMLVYSAICSIARLNKQNKKDENKK